MRLHVLTLERFYFADACVEVDQGAGWVATPAKLYSGIPSQAFFVDFDAPIGSKARVALRSSDGHSTSACGDWSDPQDVTTVPEPALALQLIVGAILLGVFRVKRSKRKGI